MRKAKRFLALVSAFVLLLTVFATAAAAKTTVSFSDVEKFRWSYSDIVYAVDHGFLKGVGNNRFAPEDACTRAMVVTVLYRAEGEPKVTFRSSFSDVKAGQWYSNAVIWAHDKGIVQGTSAATFEPNAKVTREQLTAFFYRYASSKKYKLAAGANISKFSDRSKVSSYALDAIKWAVAIGLVNGVTDKTLEPGGSATREQFAAIMVRFDKYPFSSNSGVELPFVPIN